MPNANLRPRTPNAERSLKLPKLQFSLAGLMILMTAAAILLGLAVSITGLVPMLLASLVWCVLPTPLVICAIFGRGEIRAFAVGGLIPWLLLLRNIPPGPALLVPVWLLIMPVVCGAIAVATYRWLRRDV
jgi:hypothetical protein